jgi:kynurenine formamidase
MDQRIERLVGEARDGRLSRRSFLERAGALGVGAGAALAMLGPVTPAFAQDPAPSRWERGRGWGWVWGGEDELGNLNELSPALAAKALRLGTGRVYDLGLTYDRRTYKFAGHAEGEIATYRTPAGLLKPGGVATGPTNTSLTTYASCLNSISDNVATQVDGLCHIFVGQDPAAYNGFKASDVVGDYGLLRCGVETIPPIVAPATLLDVAAHVGQDPLPESYAIEPDVIESTLTAQGVEIEPLDVVLIRTGTGGVSLRGAGVGSNHAEIAVADKAGITVAAARYLIEERGALMIGSDTTGLERLPALEEVPGGGTSFNPVHVYLLVQQGVHIGEFHNLEALARDRAYTFCYIALVNKIRGATAGFALRPIALR